MLLTYSDEGVEIVMLSRQAGEDFRHFRPRPLELIVRYRKGRKGHC